MLYETALLLDESPRMLDLLVDEWADGDIEGIASLVANPDGYGFTDAAYQAVAGEAQRGLGATNRSHAG